MPDVDVAPAVETQTEFATPMMLQYLEVKKAHSDCFVWFRLGDFYEMFLDDAVRGSQILGITLTSRARGKDGRIPMAGVPYHAADSYLAKLVRAGHKVAICEQLTEPDGCGLVERAVIRIVTPGTLLDEKHVPMKENNSVLSLAPLGHALGVALADVSTGEFWCSELPAATPEQRAAIIQDVLTQYAPTECILAPDIFAAGELPRMLRQQSWLAIFPFAEWSAAVKNAPKLLKQFFGRLGPETAAQFTGQKAAQAAAASLLAYLQHTQKTGIPHFRCVLPIASRQFVQMDRATMLNLELFGTLRHQAETGSLLAILDHTKTAMGGRLLRQWLAKPLALAPAIEARLDAVEFLVRERELRGEIRTQLGHLGDLERLLGRLTLHCGTARDVKSVQLALTELLEVKEKFADDTLPPLLHTILATWNATIATICNDIAQTLLEEPALDPAHGRVIRSDVHKKLDEWRNIVDHNAEWMQQFEQQERASTGISTLKIRYNQVFGYYIEISKANAAKAPAQYFRKQTLVNAERFTTPELKEHEDAMLQAETSAQKLEEKVFGELQARILHELTPLQTAAHAAAELDCLASLAEVAQTHHYTRPLLRDDGVTKISQGRHPVVEQLLHPAPFMPNDAELDTTAHQLMLLTGPNMAGKSVYMRQVALITLLAHLGSFVPAAVTEISLTDQLFVRSGAADMITAGQSTFMVEMTETAAILQRATAKSLIVMDEIGRGTSTYDGISIAWAVAEFLIRQPTGPKTLFATHYHELQKLADEHPDKMQNCHMAITQHAGAPVFLYQLQPGGAAHSFGVAVAALAGVPAEVVARAQELLADLEKEKKH